MVVNDYARPLKRMKRRVTADLYDFLNFTVEANEPSGDPFRLRISSFLSRHARLTFAPSLFSSIVAWQILFRIGDLDSSTAVVALDIVEEDVTRSRSVYCDQCRVVGWSSHPVCRKRYHFIIRAEESSPTSRRSCSTCGNMLQLPDTSCKCCNSTVTPEDLEDWVYSQFEDNTHYLHGLIHSNGFGHLLTLNGREGGSKKVSVMDVSKKYGMEYRLLHAITKGYSWYGNWGYEFTAGSYALTVDTYKMATDTLASMPLYPLMFQRRKPRTPLQTLIGFYKAMSETELLTLRDLFSFMLSLIRESDAQESSTKRSAAGGSNLLCPWTKGDVSCVEQAMLKVLQAASGTGHWVTWHALKGALHKSASLELLDYCLKHFGERTLASDINMMVQTRLNPISGVVEFRLAAPSWDHRGACTSPRCPLKEHVVRDLKFLYDALVHPGSMLEYRPLAARQRMHDSAVKLLDCKHFMKDYTTDQRNTMNPFAIRLLCHVELSDHPKEEPLLPPELVVLPPNASLADLIDEVTTTFRDVYVMFRRFHAESLPEYGHIEKTISLKLLVGLKGSIQVRGRCPSKHGLSRYRMERGTESWIVDCVCGTKDDDGERMLACDACEIWQHTRCAGIDNSDPVPAKFVCHRCRNREETAALDGDNSVSLSCTTCRVEVMVADKKTAAANLTFGVP
ncbi:hypothetical protein CDL15_Pgr015131 [Punica granatum]|uniref:PHD-type domain-containing protein n=1 Tax=Punica granatum TaxID=22663 RepID=A0A218VYP1_PUNGR|nr:hypothetical protein CDL15_Pgr015131 [Punica granatum]